MKNPCRGCTDKRSFLVGEERPDGRCDTYYCCSKFIDWQVWLVYEKEADPQEERGLDYHIDDREV